MVNSPLFFYETIWQRPFTLEDIEETLKLLAETRPRGPVVLESRVTGGKMHYYMGCAGEHAGSIKHCFSSRGIVRLKNLERGSRKPVTTARQLKITKPTLALNTDIVANVVRTVLASMTQIDKKESAVVQIILGPSFKPSTVGTNIESPNTTWLDRVLGNVEKASNESLKSMREKASQYSFSCAIRVGATGSSAGYHINLISTAIKTLTAAGVHINTVAIKAEELNTAKVPWKFPLRLSVKELTGLTLLPFGEDPLPGLGGLHPRVILPPDWYKEPNSASKNARIFATSENDKLLSISPQDALEHTHVLGPTGVGKSTILLNLICQDIDAGRSVLVIDPKADLVSDVMARIPAHRMEDVVVIDPADDTPVGFNPLKIHPGESPELVADVILSVFREIFSENWGIRSQDFLSAALITLAKNKDATLMWLPTLLTNEQFRAGIVGGLDDQIALRPFWSLYDSLKEGERRAQIDPVLNKFRQIMYRPSVRDILGQSHPKFDLSDLFYKRRIVLVPLNKGLIGADSARLLGSLIVGLTWMKTLSRASIPAEKRHIVSMYIDELQDYVSLPTSFADALAQARGLGLAITAANQYRAQLSPDIREGVENNCRNKIYFGLSASDAMPAAAGSKTLAVEDFISLPRYHIYTNFMSGKRQTGWVSGVTNPPTDPIRLPVEVKALSQKRYGTPASKVEEEILDAISVPLVDPPIRDDKADANENTKPKPESVKIGRKPANVPLGRRKVTPLKDESEKQG